SMEGSMTIRRICSLSSPIKFHQLTTLLCLLMALGVLAVAKAGQQAAVTLGVGSSIERELKGGEAHTFRVNLTSGQFFHVVIDQRGIDVAATLLAPDRQQITKVDGPNGAYGPEPVVVVAERAGDYLLEVSSSDKKAAPGRYEIRVIALRDATPADRNHVLAER